MIDTGFLLPEWLHGNCGGDFLARTEFHAVQSLMTAQQAAGLIESGTLIGMSGFTGSGYPKAVPVELARPIADANLRGHKFQVSVATGASTGPELDGALAMAGGIHLRLPYQSDPETRKRINAGEMEYMDIHLSHVAQYVEYDE